MCVITDDSSHCISDDDCCSGCCSEKVCVSGADHCSRKVSSDAWFIIVVYVLLPLFFVLVAVIFGIYFYKNQKRKNNFASAQREYLNRTDMLAAQISPRSQPYTEAEEAQRL